MTDQLVLLLSGPNLNLLGDREPDVYGSATLDDHVAVARETAQAHGLTVEHVQSNHEGELIDAIHGARANAAAIVINPGAFTHSSWAIHDATITGSPGRNWSSSSNVPDRFSRVDANVIGRHSSLDMGDGPDVKARSRIV